MISLQDFVAESNRIEGIHRPPTPVEVNAHQYLLGLSTVHLPSLERFVDTVAKARLRRFPGMNVRVGSHVPISGGPAVEQGLLRLLEQIHDGELSPFVAHVRYETLHPFTDGNGRSGRVLWAWHMRRSGLNPFALPYLHRWYYQSLEATR